MVAQLDEDGEKAFVPEVMVIPGSSGSLQMVDHTLIDVLLANVYLDSRYYKGHCRVTLHQKTDKSAPKERDSKKKPAQPKENDDRARENVKVKEGATEEKCVAGPVVMTAQAKKSDKVHPLKVKEAMSSVDKSTIENLQKKDPTLKKCFDRIGKPIIRENYT